MLKCPGCSRTGGPFQVIGQTLAVGETLLGWQCRCGRQFASTRSAQATPAVEPPYTGFTLETLNHAQRVDLVQLQDNESVWSLGALTLRIQARPGVPRLVTLDSPGAEPRVLRLPPGADYNEVVRRLPPLDPAYDPGVLARAIHRIVTR